MAFRRGETRSGRWRRALCLLAAAASALGGCAPVSLNLAPAELARLDTEQEIVALHYYTEPVKPTDPLREKLTNPGLTDIGMLLLPGGLILTLIDLQRKAYAPPEPAELRLNPAEDVKQRVVAQLGARGLGNLRSEWEPIRDDSREALERQFGTSAVVLVFKTTDWTVLTLPQEKNRHGFPAAVQAQLFRVSDRRVLWQAACAIPAPEADGGTPGAGQSASGNGGRPTASARWLFERVNEAADRCAADLVRQWDQRRARES